MPIENTEFLEKLENLFSYHPPKNDAEQELHAIVNEASITYAKALAGIITNPAELTTILRKIQEVRNLANFAVSCERVGMSYRDLFPPSTASTASTVR
jgi:hypothetical protein